MKQQGAALVIVMALLAGALMLGMSGMQSALIDERLAGNYRASVQSQMSGERFLAGVISDDNSENLTEFLTNSLDNIEDGETKALNRSELIALSGNDGGAELDDLRVNVSRVEDKIILEAWGAQAGAKSPTVIVLNASGSGENYRSPFLACRHIQLTGSSIAASCNSKEANCSQNFSDFSGYPDFSSSQAFIDTTSQRYNLLYNLGRDQGDSITLNGNSHVYGNVRSQQDIVLTGSSSIKGNAYAQGTIFHRGGTDIIGDEVVKESGIQQCDTFLDTSILSNKTSELKQLYGSSVGDIAVGVSSRRQWALTPEGLFYYDERQSARDCGLFGLKCLLEDLLYFIFNLLGFDACSLEIINCQSGQIGWKKYAPVINDVVVVNDLILSQEPTLIVSGVQGNDQNNPAQLRMVVEGDFSVSGGGNGLFIEDNAQLEVFVSGKTNLASNLQMGNSSASRNGQAPLTINSSYAGNGDAVVLRGGSHLVGNVFAPNADVKLLSSRVTGSIWARQINALSNSQMIFNSVNSVADSQNIESETGDDDSKGFNLRWQ